MERTLHYYNCYLTLNGEKTTLPFSELLDKIRVLDEDIRYREIKQGSYSLLKMKLPSENSNDVNDRVICVANYRNRKPFLGERGRDRLDEIPDDVLESTTCFFQNTNKLLIIEYNHYGARPKHIERYLSTFLPKTEDIYWDVELVEIEPTVGMTDIRDSNDIRLLEIKLNLSSAQRRQILKPESPQSIFANILFRTVEAHGEIGGNVATITFGNGRKKDNHLDPREIVRLLDVLDLESDLYEAIRVTYYSHQLRRVHNLDLKNAGILKKVIDFSGDSWKVVGDTIENNFYTNGRTGENNHNRFEDELIYSDLPNIIETTNVPQYDNET
jgi:hypothetical protein